MSLSRNTSRDGESNIQICVSYTCRLHGKEILFVTSTMHPLTKTDKLSTQKTGNNYGAWKLKAIQGLVSLAVQSQQRRKETPGVQLGRVTSLTADSDLVAVAARLSVAAAED